MTANRPTRENLRALVREVLARFPLENETNNAPNAEQTEKLGQTETAEKFGQTETAEQIEPNAPRENFDRDESEKSLITENDLRGLATGAKVLVGQTARFTPSAHDFINENKIEIIRRQSRRAAPKIKTVAVGADHGGYEFKEKLKDFLTAHGFQIRDFGTNSKEAVDYPDFAQAVARAVAAQTADVGIMIDGAGIGSAMAANKIKGVRAAACYSTALAKNSREHNGANLLTLGSSINSFDEIKEIVTVWLAAELTEERHRKRVEKIMSSEKG